MTPTSPRPPSWAPWPEGHRVTPFQAAVVRAVGELRRGDLATYADVADSIGRPGAGQAVANVLRRADGLAWWRVVPADGRVYRTHRPQQVPLLRAEGHEVDDDGTIRAVGERSVRRARFPGEGNG